MIKLNNGENKLITIVFQRCNSVLFFLFFVLVLTACSGGGRDTPLPLSSAPIPTANIIIGQVTANSNVLPGVTISLNGPTAKQTTTDDRGNFIFSNVSSGTHVITPIKSGYTFSPVSSVNCVNGPNDIENNFVGTSIFSAFGIISSGSAIKESNLRLAVDSNRNVYVVGPIDVGIDGNGRAGQICDAM